MPSNAHCDTIAWLVDFSGLTFRDVAVIGRLSSPTIELFNQRQAMLLGFMLGLNPPDFIHFVWVS